MSIEIEPLDDDEAWNDLVRQSASPTPLHLSEALSVLADESNTEVDRLVGYKGDHPTAIFPVFSKQVGPFTASFSPPPNLKVNYLGPSLIFPPDMKKRRRELRHGRFMDAALEWLQDNRNYVFATTRTAPGYTDVRPFIWNEFAATPRYTYIIDTTRDPDEMLDAFSTDARKNITDDHALEYTISEGGPEDIREIMAQVSARHAEQDEPFPIDAAFVIRLYEALPDGVVRVLACRSDDQFVGGLIQLELGEQGLCWLGVADYDVDLPATDLLHWAYIQRAADRGVRRYDLAGANKRRISRYKSKYAAELVPYYRVDDGSTASKLAAGLYNRLR